MKVEVINRKKYKNEDYIYVARPSKWGNPYSSKPSNLKDTIIVDSIDESLGSYKKYIMENLHLVDELIQELKDKNLNKIGCWCDGRCHAKILAQLIEEKTTGFNF